ncbi:MAG TPA: DUF1284 domain-containing protein [Candidatus Blautia merdavium]|uniref:DUF1284 domain-containing protein n=1 Tax=Candidatus Blautia merdavium TaxID=2838494 RepID=A0A9D2PQ88_9FIRM|nr:DUF1284 domain-containing protein [Candidatus Blautia merdavium]
MSRKLRAHHGMCLSFFEGKGYSDEFTAHMQTIWEEMKGNPLLLLAADADIICARCPNCREGVCVSQGKAGNYDRQVLDLCGLEEGKEVSWEEFSGLVKERILQTGRRKEICGDCQWDQICTGKEQKI